MNNVNLIGNLTSNPELRTTSTGKNVCNFSIAINSGYGENKRTDNSISSLLLNSDLTLIFLNLSS